MGNLKGDIVSIVTDNVDYIPFAVMSDLIILNHLKGPYLKKFQRVSINLRLNK